MGASQPLGLRVGSAARTFEGRAWAALFASQKQSGALHCSAPEGRQRVGWLLSPQKQREGCAGWPSGVEGGLCCVALRDGGWAAQRWP